MCAGRDLIVPVLKTFTCILNDLIPGVMLYTHFYIYKDMVLLKSIIGLIFIIYFILFIKYFKRLSITRWEGTHTGIKGSEISLEFIKKGQRTTINNFTSGYSYPFSCTPIHFPAFNNIWQQLFP